MLLLCNVQQLSLKNIPVFVSQPPDCGNLFNKWTYSDLSVKNYLGFATALKK